VPSPHSASRWVLDFAARCNPHRGPPQGATVANRQIGRGNRCGRGHAMMVSSKLIRAIGRNRHSDVSGGVCTSEGRSGRLQLSSS